MQFSFYPAIKSAGFRMEGYHVWCASVLHENGKYYLYAARWPKETGFPNGYLTHSEIVLATTDSLDKPFQFEKVILSKRDGDKWDSVMQHNPFIFKTGDKYVLYYIGSPDGGTENRAIGYAWSDAPDGEWTRSETAFTLPPDSNNPAVIQTETGDWLLYFRDGDLHVYVARAKSFEGPFEVIKENIFPGGCVEDMFVYRDADGYKMIAEDCVGAHTGLPKGGVYFTSPDGINWDEKTAVQAYTFDVEYTDGTSITLQRRERPVLFFEGERTYLFTTAKHGGEDKITGGTNWNMVQEIKG